MYSLNLFYLSQMVKAIYHNHRLHQINKITNFIIFLCDPHAQNHNKRRFRFVAMNFFVAMKGFQEEKVFWTMTS